MEKKKTKAAFMEELYRRDLLISNVDALAALHDAFPDTKAGIMSINSWKAELRRAGVKIPFMKKHSKRRRKKNG